MNQRGIFLFFLLVVIGTQSLDLTVVYRSGARLLMTGTNCGLNWTSPSMLVEMGSGMFIFNGQQTCRGNMNFKLFLMGDQEAQPHIGSLYEIQEVNEGKYTVYPRFSSESGNMVTVKNFYSPQLQNERDLNIYEPSSMVENPNFVVQKIMFLLDGQELWRYTPTIDLMHVEGKVTQTEALWVGIPSIYFSNHRYYEFAFSQCNYTTCSQCGGFWDGFAFTINT
eukprot:TRINITY_DN3952_c0_g1_i2.p2 TRINITY_DN3952_c0_g1~~TRINITY_DN3952_c0_g1_i2.p2  ORF type:complete len:223 (-),score=28.24 TRINITY_DN3952_c0_g1_i2:463-1131(-)